MNPAYGLIGWIVIGGVAGAVASRIAAMGKARNIGIDIVIGIVGAVVGGFITNRFFGDNLSNNGLFASFGVALLGSVIVLTIARMFTGNTRRLT